MRRSLHKQKILILILAFVFAFGFYSPAIASTWQELADSGNREIEKHNYEQGINLLISSLDQLSKTKVKVDDTNLERLMLYYIPDVERSHPNALAPENIEKLLNKKLEVCEKLFGENSIPTADALLDLMFFEGQHNQEIYKKVRARAQKVNLALNQAHNSYFRSAWHNKKTAHFDKVNGTKTELPSYSVATINIPRGGIISDKNTKEVFEQYPHPAGAIGGRDIMYGCRTLRPLKKGEPITTFALCKNPGPLLWDQITSSDPLWIQYAKSANIYEQKKDYAASIRYHEAFFKELKKLADSGKKLQDFTDICYLSPILTYDLCYENLPNKYSNKFPRLSGPGINKEQIAELNNRMESKFKTDLEIYNAKLNWHKNALSVLSKLLPANNSNVTMEQKNIERLSHSIEQMRASQSRNEDALSNIKKNLERLSH